MSELKLQLPLGDLLVDSAIALSEVTDLDAFVDTERELQLQLYRTYQAEHQKGSSQVDGAFRAAEDRLRARPRARALARRWALGLLKNRRDTPEHGKSAWRYTIAIPLLLDGPAAGLDCLTKSFSAAFKSALEKTGFRSVETLAAPSPYVTSGKLRTLNSAEVLGLFCGEQANDPAALGGEGVQLIYFMLTARELPEAGDRPEGEGAATFVDLATASLPGLPEGLRVQVGAPVFPGFAETPTLTPAYGEYVESIVRSALSATRDRESAVVVVRTHSAGYVELVLQSPEFAQPLQLTVPEAFCEPSSYVLEFCGVAAVNAGAQVRCEDAGASCGAPASLQ